VWPRVAPLLGLGPSLIVAKSLAVLGTLAVPLVKGPAEQVVLLLSGVSAIIGFAMASVRRRRYAAPGLQSPGADRPQLGCQNR